LDTHALYTCSSRVISTLPSLLSGACHACIGLIVGLGCIPQIVRACGAALVHIH